MVQRKRQTPAQPQPKMRLSRWPNLLKLLLLLLLLAELLRSLLSCFLTCRPQG